MKNNLYSKFKISDLIAKKIQDTISSDEAAELQKWEAKKPTHSELIRKIEGSAHWAYLQRKQLNRSSRQAAGWEKISHRIRTVSMGSVVRKSAAAAAILLLISGTSYYFIASNKHSLTEKAIVRNDKDYVRLVTGNGEVYQLDTVAIADSIQTQKPNRLIQQNDPARASLPVRQDTIIVPKGAYFKLSLADGTKVWINSNSKFIFPSRFEGNNRKVKLIGEAFFDVAPDKSCPFIIHVNQTQVKVVGTSFNINAYESSDNFAATVVSGLVQVNNNQWETDQLLSPNQQLQLDCQDGQISIEKVNTDLYTAWVRRRLIFENEKLEDIAKRIEQLYDVRIRFTDPKAKALLFTGNIALYPRASQVFDMMSKTKRITVRCEGNEIFLN
jgi:ferric-dicitrate binding protein FerR (iron transport regulator)